MKALSIRQPFAYLVMMGIKDVENRDQLWNYTGPFVIHAGLQLYKGAEVFRIEFQRKLGIDIPPLERLPRGAIIGSANIDGRVFVPVRLKSRPEKVYPSPWLTGPFGYIISNPRKFRVPIPFRVKLGCLIFQTQS